MRYYQPYKSDYQSGFVPAPLDFFQEQLQQKQGAYDKADLASHALLDATGVQARKEDQQAANDIAKSYQDKIDKLAADVQGDKSSSKYMEGIKQIGRDLNKDLTNGDLAVIKNNKEVYDKYNDQVSKFKDEDGYHEYLDSQYGNIVEGKYKGYKGDNGYNISKVGNIDKQIDRTKFVNDSLTGIGAEAIGGSGAWSDGQYIHTKSGEYVSADKVARSFQGAFNGSEAEKQLQKEAAFYADGDKEKAKEYYNEKYKDLENFAINKFTKSSLNVDMKGDPYGEADYKHKLENPIVNIGMPVTNNQWINSFGTSEAVAKQKQETANGVQSSWKQMMLDSPELWSKYGIKSAKDIDTMAPIIDKEVGFDNWMKTNGNDFGNKANTVNSSLVENRMVNQLDKEADEYALKISGITPDSLQSIVKNSKDPIVQKMSADDVLLYHNAVNTMSTYKGGPKDQRLINAEQERDLLIQKYGNIDGKSIDDTFNKLDKSQSKYNSVKDEYLADRAKTVETSQTGWSTIDVIDPNTHQVDKKSSDELNTQLQGYFSKKQNLGSINTTDGKTIQQVIDDEAKKEGVKSSQVKVGSTPLYGTGYDKTTGQVTRKMYIMVGDQQVPVDMNSVNVSINGKVQPLSQVDNNPVQQTNLWITNTFGHGIQSYTPDNTIPKETIGAVDEFGNTLVPSNAASFKVSRPATGKETNFSDNSTTKVELLNTNGQVVSTLVGAPAFQFLQSVQATQRLK